MPDRQRESLGSRIGFILLSAGCSIGLGNVWRFPYTTGMYGGGAFVVLYLIFLAMLSVPIMSMEFAVGRASRVSIIGQFRALEPAGTKWHVFSYFGTLGNYFLMMFYTVITGWMIAYFWFYISGEMVGVDTPELVGAKFGELLASPAQTLFWMALAVIIGAAICCSGLRNGVERVTKLMMSGMMIVMILLAIHAVSLPGAAAGVEFYLKPDIDRLIDHGIGTVVYAAMGQAFFTLSVGIGSMAIFGSYIDRSRSLMGEAVVVSFLDTLVAICAGFIIIPTCFAFGVEPGAGPGLAFISLPNIFAQQSGGRAWGAMFFLFMSFASISTVVAVFENIIACSMDGLGWSRTKSSVVCCISMLVLAAPCALGFNVLSHIQPFGEGSGILDLEDFIVSNNLLPIGALTYLLFCCTKKGWGWNAFINEVNAGEGLKFPQALRGYLTYCVPILIIAIFAIGYWEKFIK